MAQKPLYEMLYIIDTSLGDDQVTKYQEQIKKLITDNGGEIRKESNWGSRKLAYEIRKKSEGTYINLEFFASPELPLEISQFVNTNYAILRHLCLKVPKSKLTQEKLDADKEKKQLEDARKEREEFLRRQREAEEREKAAAAAAASQEQSDDSAETPDTADTPSESSTSESASVETTTSSESASTSEEPAKE